MRKPRQFECICGAQGNYEYIVEHAKEKGHELDQCEMGNHDYEVLKTLASASGKVLKMKCTRCGFKRKIVQS